MGLSYGFFFRFSVHGSVHFGAGTCPGPFSPVTTGDAWADQAKPPNRFDLHHMGQVIHGHFWTINPHVKNMFQSFLLRVLR